MHRPALLAGRWYPADEEACRAELAHHLREAPRARLDVAGLIGPHAGWAYSGDTAGRAYRVLHASRPDAELVAVLGSHRGPAGPATVLRATAWDTPLGPLPVDLALAESLQAELDLEDEPIRPLHADNAVELHLPFVKHLWPDAQLLMIGVPASERAFDIGRSVGRHLAGRRAVVIGSTDLTHYGPNYDFAPVGGGPHAIRWVRDVNDAAFLGALVEDAPQRALDHALAHHSACCPGAAVAALEAVRATRGHATPTLIDHTLSCEVRPDPSFVGYGALVM